MSSPVSCVHPVACGESIGARLYPASCFFLSFTGNGTPSCLGFHAPLLHARDVHDRMEGLERGLLFERSLPFCFYCDIAPAIGRLFL